MRATVEVHPVYPDIPGDPGTLYDVRSGSLKGAPGIPCHTRYPSILYDARYGWGAPDISCHTRVPEHSIRRTLR